MANFVWYGHPEDAYQNPYEYDAQRHFSREAHKFLDSLHAELNRKTEDGIMMSYQDLLMGLTEPLLKSYSLAGDRLVYDGSSPSGHRILPQTISHITRF